MTCVRINYVFLTTVGAEVVKGCDSNRLKDIFGRSIFLYLSFRNIGSLPLTFAWEVSTLSLSRVIVSKEGIPIGFHAHSALQDIVRHQGQALSFFVGHLRLKYTDWHGTATVNVQANTTSGEIRVTGVRRGV